MPQLSGPPDRYLTTAEAAKYLRYESGSGIRHLVMRGMLRPVGKRGRANMFAIADLDRYLGVRAPPPVVPPPVVSATRERHYRPRG